MTFDELRDKYSSISFFLPFWVLLCLFFRELLIFIIMDFPPSVNPPGGKRKNAGNASIPPDN